METIITFKDLGELSDYLHPSSRLVYRERRKIMRQIFSDD